MLDRGEKLHWLINISMTIYFLKMLIPDKLFTNHKDEFRIRIHSLSSSGIFLIHRCLFVTNVVNILLQTKHFFKKHQFHILSKLKYIVKLTGRKVHF